MRDDYAVKCIVIYDGECDFCKSCVAWVKARTEIEAIPNQSIDPVKYGVTKEQCEKSVVVITNKIYFSAEAIAELLKLCGHRLLAKLIIASGGLGSFGYKYVAEHRHGLIVNFLHFFIKKST